MPKITVATEKNQPVELFYQDGGEGDPVVLIHGWPVSNVMWESQMQTLIDSGRRVIAYDRRGFGNSDWPYNGYEYDTLASDLNEIITQLDLNNVTLIGFSMGGGEVARYIGNYGTSRISKAVFAAAVTPYLLKTEDNPEAVDQKVFEGILDGINEDRFEFMEGFTKAFYNWSTIGSNLISKQALEFSTELAWSASPRATVECAKAFSSTDFRQDIAKVDVPTLVIHGDSDQTVPFEVSGKRTVQSIPGARLELIKDAPHGLTQTHSEQFNSALLSFLDS